ncbi:VCBS domain-containing protein [uncultured Methylobacterium sp.]|uniref:Ig-like domain-containing protein n=1 Tax=uncultured Methylobacterium sp. TaxID=157278 RepID=UPI00260D33A4|nr:VCBS domain-containing protein [uncultured Methylobacterium sp.]
MILTTQRDEVLPSDADQTVQATVATLSLNNPGSSVPAGDRLDGGAGYDVLALSGGGVFDLSRLDRFNGFEEVRFTTSPTFSSGWSYNRLTLRDGADLTVTTDFQDVSAYSSLQIDLANSRVTIQGGKEQNRISAKAANQLQAGTVIDGGLGSDSLQLSWQASYGSFAYDPSTGLSTYTPPVYTDTVYDLTRITLKSFESLEVHGDPSSASSHGKTAIARVDNASLAEITTISLSYGAVLTTSDATLDLSGKSVSGFAGGGVITSTNAMGTTFTVDSAEIAALVAGGAGQDTVVVRNRTLTEAQREQIFAGSVETITDAAGTYAKPVLPAGVTDLTRGHDEILPSDIAQTVRATSTTLNPGLPGSTDSDRLRGGGGYDVLALSGAGKFDLAGLGQFTEFEEIRLVNASSADASLTLRDGTDLVVTLGDGTAGTGGPRTGGISVQLAASRVTLRGGNEDDTISAGSARQIQAGSDIDGGVGWDRLNLSYSAISTGGGFNPATGTYDQPTYMNTVYDLTGITLKNVESLSISGGWSNYGGATTIVKVGSRTLADVTSLTAFGGVILTTADGTLDLSKISVSGYMPFDGTIGSTNNAGTTFTVNDARMAAAIQGGAGQDTVVVKNQTLTAAQREQIFTKSVETITDASGTYTKSGTSTYTPVLTIGADEIHPTDADLVLTGTAATLNAGTPTYSSDGSVTYSGGDRLDGGAGYDVLALSGAGSFNLAGLGQFAGFEEVRLTNATGNRASLTLRDGADLAVTLSDGTSGSAGTTTGGIAVQLADGRVTLRGGSEADEISAGAANQLRAGSVIDGGAGSDSLRLNYKAQSGTTVYDPVTKSYTYVPPVHTDTVYDLTAIDLTDVETLVVTGSYGGYGNTTTVVTVDADALADVTTISLAGRAKLVTQSAALDLTGKTITGTPGTAIESRSATGTTFTVDSSAAAALLKGGSGEDKVVLVGGTLTAAQREQLFLAGVETVIDAGGTFTQFTVPADGATLTTGRDVILPSDADQIVTATAATLNAGSPLYGLDGSVTYTGGDRLEGGAGRDVLSLSGGGSFNLAGLDRFTDFEEVRVTIPANSSSEWISNTLTLRDDVDLAVTLSAQADATGYYGFIQISLANSRVTVSGGEEVDSIWASATSGLQAGTVIDGGGGRDQLWLNYDYTIGNTRNPTADTTYDLNAIVLRNVERLTVQGGSKLPGRGTTIVKASTTALAGIETIDLSFGAKLFTADASLDLSGMTIGGMSGGGIESTNAAGTTFTTDRAVAAGLIRGGVGRDTVVVTGEILTAAQRELVFSGSVETIIDAAGTYAKPDTPADATTLTPAVDTLLPMVGDQVVNATAATLTNGTSQGAINGTRVYAGGDRLDGGAGRDVLALLGPGLFNLASLGQFSGFEEVRLVNPTSATASLKLRDGADLLVTLGDGGAAASETGGITVELADSVTTLHGGNESDTILAARGSHLRAGSVIDGGQGFDNLSLNEYSAFEPLNPSAVPEYYDLTSIVLRNVEGLSVFGRFGAPQQATTSVKVDAASLSDVRTISLSNGARLVTEDATLDLTGRTIDLFAEGAIESTRTTGTTFTVDSLAAAALIRGRVGLDTVVVKGMTLTGGQRAQILATSAGTLVDAAGTYGPDGFVNYNPTPVTDTASAGVGGVVARNAAQGVLANDSDAESDPLRVASVNGEASKVGQAVEGTFGTLTLAADGSYVYAVRSSAPAAAAAPDAPLSARSQTVGETNHDRFTYTVADSRGGTAEAVLDITVDPFGPTDDVYLVTGPDDVVTELPGGGNDTVRTSLTRYTLDANVETLVYIGRPTFHGIGNDLDNLILGGRNSDRLEGAGGSDTMVGGTGNDTYTVDDARDVVVEQAGESTDRVLSQVSYTLSDNVEILALTTSASLNGIGNALDNTIRGNRGRNVLDGRGGADTLIGGEGADVFVLRAWESDGDVIQDFAGAGAAGGDRLEFRGFGAGAFLSHEAGSDLYTIHAGPALGGMSETFRLAGVTGLDLLSGTASGDVTFAA